MENLKIGIWELNNKGIESDNYSISLSSVSAIRIEDGLKVWYEPVYLFVDENYGIQDLMDLIKIMAIARIENGIPTKNHLDTNTIKFIQSGGSEQSATDTRLFEYRAAT